MFVIVDSISTGCAVMSTTFTHTSILSVPGVPYNVSIAAVNRAGPGEFSVFIHFTKELGKFQQHTVFILVSVLHSTKYFTQGSDHHSTLSYCHGGVMDSSELL